MKKKYMFLVDCPLLWNYKQSELFLPIVSSCTLSLSMPLKKKKYRYETYTDINLLALENDIKSFIQIHHLQIYTDTDSNRFLWLLTLPIPIPIFIYEYYTDTNFLKDIDIPIPIPIIPIISLALDWTYISLQHYCCHTQFHLGFSA